MSKPTLDRADVMKKLMTMRGDALAIAGLGSPVWDIASSDHRPENFYLWGGMGCAVSMGLGCAMAQRGRNVWVVTGDGEALMGVGSFATVAAQRPSNLAVIVLDNEHYGETGTHFRQVYSDHLPLFVDYKAHRAQKPGRRPQ